MPADAQSLEIRLLGEPEIVVDGRRRELPASKKTRALLGYLVKTERPQRRERLCELLWDGPDDPRAGLRWSLAKLRPLVDAGSLVRLVADRERVSFEQRGAEVDVLALRGWDEARVQAARTEALASALAHFRGPFLEGLELSSCPSFHAWCVAEREALRTLHVALLTTLIERERAEPARAIGHARALIALDPLAESPRVMLLDLLAALGDARRALDEYADYVRTLRRELGTEPSFELERRRLALIRAPAGGSVAAAATEPPKPAAAAAESSSAAPERPVPLLVQPAIEPFVGRQLEREQLARLLDGLDRAPALLVLGEPGIGKTRLLEELGRLARERGGFTLSGRAFEAELVRPYGAFIDALRKAPVTSPFDAPAADRTHLYDAVLALLAEWAARQPPLVIIVDDLHWFDEASAELFHYLARASAGSGLVLAASARPAELADNPAAQRLIRALGRERLITTLELGPLSEHELRELVGGDANAAALAPLLSEAAGNPLFALEAARAARAESQDPSVSLARLMAERLARLQDAERGLLSWAAALGRSFDVDVLARVTGLSIPELLSSLERLELHAILRSRDAGYDFAHDLLRHAAYRQMSGPRQRLVHAQIARALSAAPDPDGALASDVAHHAALSGDRALAARACVSAGRRCLRLFASRDARELAMRGLRLAESLPDVERLPLAVELMAIQVWVADRPELDGAIVALAQRARELGLAAVEARAYFVRSIRQFRADDAKAALESSLLRIEAARHASVSELGAEFAGAARCCLMIEKDLGTAGHFVEQARQILGEDENVDLTWAQGLLAHARGDLDAAAQHVEKALAMLRRQQGNWEECECLLELTWIDVERGRHDRALANAHALALVAHKVGEGVHGPAAESLRALASIMADAACSFEPFDQSLFALRAASANRVLAMALNRAAELALARGADSCARRYAAEALEAAERVERVSEIIAARGILAELALRAGEITHARDQQAALARYAVLSDLPARSARTLDSLRTKLGS